ncbi:MAG: hypothetical protein AB1637_09585 [Elusimicrobiota bacterium]
MKNMFVLSLVLFFANSYGQNNNTEKTEINKYVISEEDEKKTFEEMAEDASRKIKEWVKKFKVSGKNKIASLERSSSKKEDSKDEIKIKTVEEELNSEEFKKERDILFKYLSAEDSESTRKQLQIMRKKFPALAKEERLGFKYNEAKAFIWEKKFAEAKKLLSEIVSEMKKLYPTAAEMEKLSESDKIFFIEVLGKRGIISLFVDKDYLRSADDLEEVLNIMPKLSRDKNYERVYAHLASALVMSNRIKEAAKWYAKAFEVYPNFNKRPNEHTNICKNIINAGYLDICPPCKDVAEKI